MPRAVPTSSRPLFAEELSLRAQHRLHVSKLAGLVRAAFPDDRATQDLVFPLADGNELGGGDDEPEGSES